MEGSDNSRCADPIVVQHFFQAIEFIRNQRQIANIPRIVKYMEREFGTKPTEILQNLHKAVLDGLVIETITMGCKGSKAGVEQEGYWIPDKEQMLYDKEGESHDWYCFICHTPGKVLSCSTCPFVYHPTCLLAEFREKGTDKKWICPYCTSVVKVKNKQQHNELGRCLNFIVNQETDFVLDLKKRLEEQAVHHDFFVYSYYDLTSLKKDCQKGLFSSIEEFQNKVKLIHHNYSIMFGEKHRLTKSAKKLVQACLHEIKELKLCKNCFFLSNTKPMKEWFCQPCAPPHQVVWAKQKGFDFWPAKVIQVTDDQLDVRFFGKHHPRAWVPIDAVRCISVSPFELRVKRKQHWKQSSIEMKEYIRQCECALGAEEASKIIQYDSPYGIGKNEGLVKKMVSMGKHCNEDLSSLNFDLNISKSKRNSHESDTSSHPLVTVKEEPVECDEILVETRNKDLLNSCLLPEVVITHAQKRQAEQELESHDTEVKKRKTEFRHIGVQTNDSCLATELPGDPDDHQCNCKVRYSTILQKFKDYVIESNRLQKGKLIRAAAFKAAYEQRQAEDQTRKDVTAEFEEAIAEMKINHQKQLEEAKSKQWVVKKCC